MKAEYIGEKMSWTVGLVQAPGCVLTVPMPASTCGPVVPPPLLVPCVPPSFEDVSPLELLPHAEIADALPAVSATSANTAMARFERVLMVTTPFFGKVDSRSEREALDAAYRT